MKDNKKEGYKCCICSKHKHGWGENKQYGNNPSPLKDKGQCCDMCNILEVIPLRLGLTKNEVLSNIKRGYYKWQVITK